jgi:DNA-binding beta-propeller fold protein YncE
VDNDSHRLVTLDRNGKRLWSKGSMGRNREEFRFPFMLDLDKDGNIYVVEVINTRVQVLAPDGSHVRFIGDWGIEPGQFFRPKGIAVSEQNEVYVSDSYLGVIQVFSREGPFLGVVGDAAGNLLKFTTPVGITIEGNRLFVIEMWKNRLLVLEKVAP